MPYIASNIIIYVPERLSVEDASAWEYDMIRLALERETVAPGARPTRLLSLSVERVWLDDWEERQDHPPRDREMEHRARETAIMAPHPAPQLGDTRCRNCGEQIVCGATGLWRHVESQVMACDRTDIATGLIAAP